MSLAVRIIPVLLNRNGLLVKGKRFDSWRVVGHSLQAARIHAARGVDELMILNIGNHLPDCNMVRRLTKDAFTPITVGGGIHSNKDVRDMLNVGADKVCIKQSQIITTIAAHFGSQAICASLEVNGRKNTVEQAQELERVGVGEILLQSVERDGEMGGYDLSSIRKVSQAVNIPVIASCGAGTYQHMVEAVEAGASAVAAGAMFQFTNATPKGAAEYLSSRGIETRH